MKANFCMMCASALEGQTSNGTARCPNCQWVFYDNPIPAAGIFIINENKVLLGRRANEPHKGSFDIIGGFLESREHPLDGLRREVLEETGLQVTVLGQLGIYMDTYGHEGRSTLGIIYVGFADAGLPTEADDVEELKWFDINDLPEGGFPSVNQALGDLKSSWSKWQELYLQNKPGGDGGRESNRWVVETTSH